MNYNPFSLQGKTILVTGASSGIGRATAIECSKMNVTLVITGRNKERLHDTFCQLEGNGHMQITADLKCSEEIEVVLKKMPKIQGIVHCAGIAEPILFQFTSKEK